MACSLRAKAYYKKHKDSLQAKSKMYHTRNRKIILEKTHLKKYGISLATKRAIFIAQGKKCGICGSNKPGSKNGWHMDHNHKLETPRGVLCFQCNSKLGLVENGKVNLFFAYLEKWK